MSDPPPEIMLQLDPAKLRNISKLVAGLCILCVIIYYAVREYRRPPLPPGPKGRFPWMGMTFDMPKHHVVSDSLL